MDDLHRRLEEAAQAHRPDRERMLARIERGMAGPEQDPGRPRAPRPAPWLRVVAVTAAGVATLGVGVFAYGAVTGGTDTSGIVATTPGPASPPGAPAPGPSDSGRQVEPAPSRTPRPTGTPEAERTNGPSATPTPDGTPDPAGTTGATTPGAEDGYLWSDGSLDPNSNDYWAQSNVTIKAERPLNSLTVELRVAQTGGVKDTGSWRSLPVEDFVVSARMEDGDLVFRWTLKDGVVVPAGEHVFAGQYDHAEGGRDAGDDRYSAVATSSGRTADVGGDFAPDR
nr:hypothetical protein OH820_34750 [Streptomyces sp. NBC_00857]